MSQCQSVVGGKLCREAAEHTIDMQVADPASIFGGQQMFATDFVRVDLCKEHAGFEHELRTVEDATPPFQPDACPYCGRNNVCGPDFPGGLLVHTIPETFDLCEGEPAP